MLDKSRLFATPETIPRVAVAVCQGADNRHVGIAYRTNQGAMFLDQAWHKIQRVNRLEDTWEYYNGRVVFACPDMVDDRAKAVSGLCRAIASDIAKGTSKIFYAFRYDPASFFDASTGRLAMPNGNGLTCVTYVLVIFKTAQIPLIDFEGWPERDEDVDFHKWLVTQLEGSVDPEHLAAIKGEVRCVRTRPEEAGGACLCIGFDEPAVKYTEASAAGLVLLAALQAQPTL